MLNIYDLNKKMCKYVTHLQSTFFVLKENDDSKSRVTLVYYRKMITMASNDANEIIYVFHNYLKPLFSNKYCKLKHTELFAMNASLQVYFIATFLNVNIKLFVQL